MGAAITSRPKAGRKLRTRRHSATKAPAMPGAASIGAASWGRRAGIFLKARVSRSSASSEYSRHSPASAAKDGAESAGGRPRAACPNSTARYQRNGRIALQPWANAFMVKIGNPTPA